MEDTIGQPMSVVQHLFYSDVPSNLQIYNNMIPVCRYHDYCNIKELFIDIKTKEPITLKIDYYYNDGSIKTIQSEINNNTIQVESAELKAILLDVSSSDLKKIDYGLVYVPACRKNTIKLAHVVCTYHREDAIDRKMESFREMDQDGYHMFIIDNGCTLKDISDEKISILQSPNYGGSSGFSRGMDVAVSQGFTHILLNDDDASLDPESVFRLISFLELLEEGVEDLCISGIMLDSHDVTKIYSTGGCLDEGGIQPCSGGLDVSEKRELIHLLDEQRIDFSDWTLFCIPTKIVQRKGLALPLFIWYDDVEYGLRLKTDITTLPGVSVWHPTRFDRFSTAHRYYETRNRLVTLCVSKLVSREHIEKVFESILIDVACYRYKCAEESLCGVEDFLLGPDHLFSLCQKGMRASYPLELDELDQLRDKMDFVSIPGCNFIIRKYTMNGLLLPSLGDVEASPFELDTAKFYRAKRILYQYNSEKGFVAERNLRKAILFTIKVLRMKRKVLKVLPELTE